MTARTATPAAKATARPAAKAVKPSAKQLAATVADLVFAHGQARRGTDARNALVAYAVIVEGQAQTTLVATVGLDKGDVSRVVKAVKGSPAAMSALKSLARTGDRQFRIDEAADFGAQFTRRTKSSNGNRKAQTKGTTTGKVGTPNEPGESMIRTEADAAAVAQMSPADLLAALAILRDAARSLKFTDDQSAELSVIAMDLADLSVA